MAGVRKNLVANAYASAAVIVGQVALVPLFIWAWGDGLFGYWLVLCAVPTCLGLADGGLTEVLGNQVTVEVERGNLERAGQLTNSVWSYQARISLAALGALQLIALLLPLKRWMGLIEIDYWQFQFVFIAMGISSLATIQSGIFAAVFRAARLYPTYLWSYGNARMFETALVAGGLVLSLGISSIAAIMMLARLAWCAYLYVRARQAIPRLELAWTSGTWNLYREMLPNGLRFFAFPLGNALINQGVTIAVNSIAGPSAVVVVSVCRQAARFFVQTCSVLFTSVHPELTTAFARNDIERMLKLQAGSSLLMFAMGGAFSVIFWWLGPAVLETWSGSVHVDPVVALFFALEAVSFSTSSIARLVPWATSCLGALPSVFLLGNVGALASLWAFWSIAGEASVPLSFAVANVLLWLVAMRQSLRFFNIGFFQFIRCGLLAVRSR